MPAGSPRLSHATVKRLLGRFAATTEGLSDALASSSRCARFLRGLAEFEVRSDDVFISSYPRSGTTWLQQILLVLSRGADPQPAHISEASPWFERKLALGRATADDFKQLPSPRIFKSHLPYAWLPRGARYVYALRDGRDVLVSYFHLYRSHLGYEGDFSSFFERFMRGQLQYGSWFKHVAGWRAVADRKGVYRVRYEAMLEDLTGVMAQLGTQLGFEQDPRRIDELSSLCTFDYMKAREARFDHATEELALRGMATGQFVRQGHRGAHSDYLEPAQQQRFNAGSVRPPWLPTVELNLAAFLH